MRTYRFLSIAAVLSAVVLSLVPSVGRCQGGFTDGPHTLRRPAEEGVTAAPARTFGLNVLGRWVFLTRLSAPPRMRPARNVAYSRPVSGFTRQTAAR